MFETWLVQAAGSNKKYFCSPFDMANGERESERKKSNHFQQTHLHDLYENNPEKPFYSFFSVRFSFCDMVFFIV